MITESFDWRLDHVPRPRDSLRAAENAAMRFRRCLRHLHAGLRDSGWSKSLDDAVRWAELIEELARYGQRCPAAEANELVDRLEPLVQELADRVFGLLASIVSV